MSPDLGIERPAGSAPATGWHLCCPEGHTGWQWETRHQRTVWCKSCDCAYDADDLVDLREESL